MRLRRSRSTGASDGSVTRRFARLRARSDTAPAPASRCPTSAMYGSLTPDASRISSRKSIPPVLRKSSARGPARTSRSATTTTPPAISSEPVPTGTSPTRAGTRRKQTESVNGRANTSLARTNLKRRVAS